MKCPKCGSTNIIAYQPACMEFVPGEKEWELKRVYSDADMATIICQECHYSHDEHLIFPCEYGTPASTKKGKEGND